MVNKILTSAGRLSCSTSGARAIEFETGAKRRRLADEYDAAQECGKVQKVGKRGNQLANDPKQGNVATAEIGLSHKEIAARQTEMRGSAIPALFVALSTPPSPLAKNRRRRSQKAIAPAEVRLSIPGRRRCDRRCNKKPRLRKKRSLSAG